MLKKFRFIFLAIRIEGESLMILEFEGVKMMVHSCEVSSFFWASVLSVASGSFAKGYFLANNYINVEWHKNAMYWIRKR